MASVPTVASASVASSRSVSAGRVTCPKFSPRDRHCSSTIVFGLAARPIIKIFNKEHHSIKRHSALVRAQPDEAAVDETPNTAAPLPPKSEQQYLGSSDGPDGPSPKEPSPPSLHIEGSISTFISQVADLIKLVDSKDIAELQLKKQDCELVIRKKDAIPQPQSPAVTPMLQSYAPPPTLPPPLPSTPPESPVASAPTPLPALPPPKSTKSSTPPFKAPMPGTFYRKPAPDKPPYVEIGHRVTTGQILCIIEAMKTMNKVESDRDGTVSQILVEDAEPVFAGKELFVIEP